MTRLNNEELKRRQKLYDKFGAIIEEYGKSSDFEPSVIDDVIEKVYLNILDSAVNVDSGCREDALKENKPYYPVMDTFELERILRNVISRFHLDIFELTGVLESIKLDIHYILKEAHANTEKIKRSHIKPELLKKFGFENLN